MRKDEEAKPSADVAPQVEPVSETIENAHAAGDGALSKSDEELPQPNAGAQASPEQPAY